MITSPLISFALTDISLPSQANEPPKSSIGKSGRYRVRLNGSSKHLQPPHPLLQLWRQVGITLAPQGDEPGVLLDCFVTLTTPLVNPRSTEVALGEVDRNDPSGKIPIPAQRLLVLSARLEQSGAHILLRESRESGGQPIRDLQPHVVERSQRLID